MNRWQRPERTVKPRAPNSRQGKGDSLAGRMVGWSDRQVLMYLAHRTGDRLIPLAPLSLVGFCM